MSTSKGGSIFDYKDHCIFIKSLTKSWPLLFFSHSNEFAKDFRKRGKKPFHNSPN